MFLWKSLTLHSSSRLSPYKRVTLERARGMSMSISWPWKSISTMSHCDPHPSADELAALDPASSPSKRVSPRYEGASGPAICVAETLMLAPAMLVFVSTTSVSIARVSHATLSTFLAIFATPVVGPMPTALEMSFDMSLYSYIEKGPKTA